MRDLLEDCFIEVAADCLEIEAGEAMMSDVAEVVERLNIDDLIRRLAAKLTAKGVQRPA